MATVMTRAQFKRSLQEGINAYFGMALERRPEQWKQLYESKKATKAQEELVLRVGLGGAAYKAEGAPVAYDSGGDAWNRIARIDTWGLAFAITEEAIDDNLYGNLATEYGSALALAHIHTREVNAAVLLNNATDSSNYAVGDGVALLSTSHPLYAGGTYANKPTSDVDLSEAALEDALTAISLFNDDRGIPQVVKAQSLNIHPAQWAVADRLLNSTLRSGTADNDKNVLSGRFPGGVNEFHYMTDQDMWFIKTDAPMGFIFWDRKPLKKGIEGDFETGNMRYRSVERYKFDVFNPRIIYGSVGA